MVVLGLIVVAGVGVAVWLVVRSLFTDPAVAGPIIAASVALAVFAGGEFFTRRRVAQQYRWDKIAPTYQEFVELVRRLGKADHGDDLPADVTEFMGRFSDQLLLWGSPKVIQAWVQVVRMAEQEEGDKEAVLGYAKVLLAIRQDLGHGDRTLDTRDLLRVVITDIDAHLPPGGSL